MAFLFAFIHNYFILFFYVIRIRLMSITQLTVSKKMMILLMLSKDKMLTHCRVVRGCNQGWMPEGAPQADTTVHLRAQQQCWHLQHLQCIVDCVT